MRRDTTFITRKTSRVKILCLLLALFVSSQLDAQTPVFRTTTLYTGSSPFQDSMWACNVAENTVVRRLGPTLPGFTITGMNGIATDPTTGEHYCIMKVSGVSGRVLGKVNIQTGVCTQVGNLGDNFSTLAFNANGNLFGVVGDGGSSSEVMFRIDKANAATTVFRPLGAGLDGEVIAYCPDNHKFYHWSGNGTVVWERFDTSGTDVIQSLTYTGTPSGETFGAMYIGNGQFLVSNISSHFRIWDTSGNIGSAMMSLPDDLRGLVREVATSSITPSGPTTFCMGSSVTFTGSAGTSNYQWYQNGVAISGATNSTYVASTAGVYNAIFTDSLNDVDSMATGFTVIVNPIPTITPGTMPQVCFGATSTGIPFTGTTDVISNTVSFGYSGSATTWTVPAGVASITVDAQGAAGGSNSDPGTYVNRPGNGARVTATLAVTPGQVLNIYVGGKGSDGTSISGGAGGFNGGGNGNYGFGTFAGGGGGGATDIRIGGTSFGDRVLVAAGGGGAGLDCGGDLDRGGDGGTLTGEDGGGLCNSGNGGGGTPSAGGAAGACACIGTGGMPGAFGIGGDAGVLTAGGGGGAGYYGGGGAQWDGGGGGSSYSDALLATSVTHTRGVNTLAGALTITYSIPTFYNLNWDPGATSAGFIDAGGSMITASPVPVTIPGTASVGTHTGILTLTNIWTGCTTAAQPVSITINAIPDVAAVASQTVCNGATTTAVNFTGSLSGTNFNWTNSNTSIGLAASGSGNIGTFAAINTSNVPVTAVVTVTPERLGCFGPVQTFTITVNPTPNVAPSSNQTVCNATATAAVNFTGTVLGTVFNWTNTDATIGLAASGSGDIASFTAVNAGTASVTAVITVNTTANGCTGSSNSFTITVDPTPTLTSALNPPAICDNTVFSYTPTSATIGTTFDWSRDSVTGISNSAATGSGDPMETLMNTTANPIVVSYVYTLTAAGCVNTQTVQVIVNPTPMLTSVLTPAAVCDSTLFEYIHTSATVGTTFSWSRDFVPGITNPASSGVDTIREYLVNTTPNPIMVTYIDTLMANGCINIQSIMLTVNPRPMLTTPLVMSPVCDSSAFMYVPASATTGTTFSWSRAAITGIANPAASGADTISETLYNTTVNPITVIYVDTLKANGCMNTQEISIVINPTPKLNSDVTPPGVCDSALFNYTPTSGTLGSVFSWTRPYVLGIDLIAGSGMGNPNEVIRNQTNTNLDVDYIYTITANGCTHTQVVTVVSHPTPTLSSYLSTSVCSGSPFHYIPSSYVFGTSFAWSRSNVPGIKPAALAGTGTIYEILTDTALVPLVTTYTINLTANGCPAHKQFVTVTVNPTPPMLPITTHSPASLCSNTRYQNFGTNTMPPMGQHYEWTATNATVMGTGNGGQYSLISFNTPGTAVVTLKSNVIPFSTCVQNSSYTVTVGTGVSDNPKVVYYNGQLICLQADEESYQWGFDDAHTLDSAIIEGEKNPNYFISGPDFINRYYWVMTTRGGCMQKTYYNLPVGITDINAGDQGSVKLYPNPANDYVNVEIITTTAGDYSVEVVNMLGQKLRNEPATDKKARIDIASLPAGIYLVEC